jgi:hypothetical protein
MANEMQSCNQAYQEGRRSQPLRLRTATPRAIATSSANHTAGCRKFVRHPDVAQSHRISGTVESVAKPQLSDIKPKV